MSESEISTHSFEESLAELKQLVEQMETGELTLDQALAAFERGIALTRHCQTSLEQAQQRIEVLTRQGGKLTTVPLEETNDQG